MPRNATITAEVVERRKRGGEYFRILREDNDLSQADVARRLGYSYYNTISQWERGTTPIPLEMYEPICVVFHVNLGEFTRTITRLTTPEAHRLYTIAYGPQEQKLEESKFNGKTQ